MRPVEMLEILVKDSQDYDRLTALLANVRCIDESNVQTLERLIKERAAVVRLFERLNIKSRLFDSTYKDNFMDALETVEERLGR